MTDSNRQSGCAHYSAMIIVLGNIIASFSSPLEKDNDIQLVSTSLETYTSLLEGFESPLHDSLVYIIHDLRKLALATDYGAIFSDVFTPMEDFTGLVPMYT